MLIENSLSSCGESGFEFNGYNLFSGWPTIGCIAERCFDGSQGIHPVDPVATIHFVAERRLKPVPAIFAQASLRNAGRFQIQTGG
jgi:hypothetical protein